ncbi:acidic mammalian chitinase-like [Dermacentor andersoni]|uniref:acidic mammalian chitinase-like n=1 Tax=Dermacentor andersoni TaxID=34620 RepID=UPI00241690BB|nr:chitotriosidase-1-like [Dermacentor andersoni]
MERSAHENDTSELHTIGQQAWLKFCVMLVTLQCFFTSTHCFDQVCYFPAPTSPEALPLAMVNVSLCSHIILGFAAVGDDYSVDLDPVGGQEALASLSALRKRRAGLKLMISVGGGDSFKEMASTASRRQRFINSAAWALRTADLDGLDLDWEFPSPKDANNFVHLLEEASEELKNDPERPLLLSVAVPAPLSLVLESYDVLYIAKYADFVNLMTYDMHTYHWYTPFVDHNSPLFARSGELPFFNTLNLAYSANAWATLGMPKSKIMVGIPTYGLSWVLKNPTRWQVGSLATGCDKHGGGFVTLPEVCALLSDGAQREYDAESMVPYLHKEKLWVSYDDQASVALKTTWILRNGYGGTMTFSLSSDDWAGKCGNGSFPLQSVIAHFGTGNYSVHLTDIL